MKGFLCVCFLYLANSINAQIITTVAGNGTYGYSGDGGTALNAQLSDMYYCYPAIDKAGNIYISHNTDNTIRKIDPSGIITTIAGTKGVIGYSGDGGPAVNALLYHPTSIAIDNSNNIYFADRNGDIIRKIDPAGIITTVTGPFTVSCGVGDGGSLSSAQMRTISAMTFDKAGNLYISDYGCDIVRKVNAITGIITTIAGNQTEGFSGDGGPATAAQLNYPSKVAIDDAGNVYIPDARNHRIRRVDAVTGIITTVMGNGTAVYSGDGGPAINAGMPYPGTVLIDKEGNFYISDSYDENMIRKIDASGTITRFAGTGVWGYTGDGGPALNATIAMTQGLLSIDDNDNIYFVNYLAGHVIRKIELCKNPVTPALTITASAVTICKGATVTYNAIAEYGGTAPVYQWMKNGLVVGSGGAVYVDNNLSDNDVISCMLTSNENCISAKTAASNGIQITVSPVLIPSVTIIASSENICAGTSVTFTATVLNAGPVINYTWYKNTIAVSANSPEYTDNTLKEGDIIVCTIQSSGDCVSPTPVTSSAVTMHVNSSTASITISSSVNAACAGTPVTFRASTTGAGTGALFQWKKNGANVGTNSDVYTTESLLTTDAITCILTSGSGCGGSSQTTSNAVSVTIYPTPSGFLPAEAAICSNEEIELRATQTFRDYLWSTGSVTASIVVRDFGQFSLEVTDDKGCRGKETVTVLQKNCTNGFFMPTAFTPNNDGKNDFLKPSLTGNVTHYRFQLYNRWGQLVFQSTEVLKGWDGSYNGVQQDSGIFIWVCSYEIDGGPGEIKKGTAVLIR